MKIPSIWRVAFFLCLVSLFADTSFTCVATNRASLCRSCTRTYRMLADSGRGVNRSVSPPTVVIGTYWLSTHTPICRSPHAVCDPRVPDIIKYIHQLRVACCLLALVLEHGRMWSAGNKGKASRRRATFWTSPPALYAGARPVACNTN